MPWGPKGRKKRRKGTRTQGATPSASSRPPSITLSPVPIFVLRRRTRVHAKWMVAARDLSDDEDGEEVQRWGCQLPNVFLRPLEKALHPFTRETLLMELLAAEHSDEELDYGEPEGSGDDYDS
ncbi:hypothetical protein B0H13DRAFT_1876382 [Mycena leptocephala]|nr:hypothetical protein B0H13DRAFT_1876382 [Mycena leptocephala]